MESISRHPLILGTVGRKTYGFFRKQVEIEKIARTINKNSTRYNNFNNRINKYKLVTVGIFAGICTEAISLAPLLTSFNYTENNQTYAALATTTWSVLLRYGIHSLFNKMGKNLETVIENHKN